MADALGLGRVPVPRRFRPSTVLLRPVQLLVRGAERGWLMVAGRLLLLTALALGLFVVFELFLSPLMEWRAQVSLLSTFQTQIVTTTLDRATGVPAEGSPVAMLQIPRIGLNQVVVEGTSPGDLKSGPGHLRAAPLPGEFGNAVIAGRRTTYGAPFAKLTVLAKGDKIKVITGQGLYTYVVRSVTHIVPGQPDPVMGTTDTRLTLITSDPAYLASGRLAVTSQLQGLPSAVAQRAPAMVGNTELGLGGDGIGLGFGMFWGELLLVVLIAGWLQRRRWPAAVICVIGAPLTLALLVLTFSSIDLLFPGTL